MLGSLFNTRHSMNAGLMNRCGWHLGMQGRNLFLHFIWIVFLGVGIPFMHAQGFTDPAMSVTLTRTGSGMPMYSPHVFPLGESVYRGTEPSAQVCRLFPEVSGLFPCPPFNS